MVGLHRDGFFLRLEVDEAASPWDVGEGTPLGGDERRVVVVLARTDNARVLVEGEGDLGLEREARPFEDDFGQSLLDMFSVVISHTWAALHAGWCLHYDIVHQRLARRILINCGSGKLTPGISWCIYQIYCIYDAWRGIP
jgi:hypothetical protein